MRVASALRLYALAVFFLVLVGGIVLKPGAPRDAQASLAATDAPVATAGLAR